MRNKRDSGNKKYPEQVRMAEHLVYGDNTLIAKVTGKSETCVHQVFGGTAKISFNALNVYTLLKIANRIKQKLIASYEKPPVCKSCEQLLPDSIEWLPLDKKKQIEMKKNLIAGDKYRIMEMTGRSKTLINFVFNGQRPMKSDIVEAYDLIIRANSFKKTFISMYQEGTSVAHLILKEIHEYNLTEFDTKEIRQAAACREADLKLEYDFWFGDQEKKEL